MKILEGLTDGTDMCAINEFLPLYGFSPQRNPVLIVRQILKLGEK